MSVGPDRSGDQMKMKGEEPEEPEQVHSFYGPPSSFDRKIVQVVVVVGPVPRKGRRGVEIMGSDELPAGPPSPTCCRMYTVLKT